jgi:Mrp family chromosome partitioning ATPase
MFRQFAANARKAMDAGGVRSVAILSANPGGGTTTVVSNLAESLHAIGRSVAVVDANLRRPRLASIFGADPDAPGLSDMLAGRAVEPQVRDGIAVYGPGTPDSRVYERLSTDEMRRVIARLREKHQVVILDLPPTLVAGESMVVADACDAAVLVIRAQVDERGLVGKLVGQLQDSHAVLLGTLLMRPEHTVGGYFRKNAELMAEYAKPASAPAPAATAAAAPASPGEESPS